jgi:PadR family transcriptional regulator, regulatory protein AphA
MCHMTHVSLRHAILGFLGLEPSTGYLLAQRFEGSVGSFWSATQSQIYRELHALETSGQVVVEVVPQEGKPARKVYSLTADGRSEFARWQASPIEPAQLRDPFLLRFVFAADSQPDVLDEHLARYVEVLEATRAEYQARLHLKDIFSLARSPREALVWRLSLENGLAWVEAQVAWGLRARRALRPRRSTTKRSRRKVGSR